MNLCRHLKPSKLMHFYIFSAGVFFRKVDVNKGVKVDSPGFN
jgi:hypothetical protein